MAVASPTATPAATPVMSRRAPLTSNPNVANSPLRGASVLAAYPRQQKRSFANIQREEPYGQPPPVKKQALDGGSQRALRSPARAAASRSQVLVQRAATSAARPGGAAKERVLRVAVPARAGHDVDGQKEVWKRHYRAKFPKMVFYFESIPDDVRAKLTKRVTYFGARQEPFFSIDVTHVITTRSIPAERSEAADGRAAAAEPEAQPEPQPQPQPQEQPQTINPSLLDRNTAARRKLLFEFRQAPVPSQPQHLDEAVARRGKTRGSNDVLHKAREMGKKIWSLDKFQHMLSVLLESEGGDHATTRASAGSRAGQHQEPDLLQLLHNERISGPSDRDPTAVNRELVYFRGPHIYVWDMDEKQKPIMVRQYEKVSNKADGEWPQFRSVGNGRCPFVEDVEDSQRDQRRQRERARAAAAAAAAVAAAAAASRREGHVSTPKPAEGFVAKPTSTGSKRTLAEMEDSQGKATAAASDVLNPAKAVLSKQVAQNAFTSRAEAGRLLQGEPAASGLQPSNVTSAIRSQMVSSTSGINGAAKAGTSKEVHGLQRKVLQKKAATPASQDPSSRRVADVSMDVASSRSTTMGRQTSRTVQAHDDDSQRAASRSQALQSKKDLKPGYCENCQDKFRDFDEHITSHKHRKFAEKDENWSELDLLLAQLERTPRFRHADDEGALVS